ncbi:MAG TPA: hypothetical protein VIF33_02140 [Casimicrobiaceae bacterium]|jgi:hypothetical protein
MMKILSLRAWTLAAALAGTASLGLAQSPPPPGPMPAPRDATPLGPPLAQPPMPSAPAGTLTQSAKGAEARGAEAPESRWQAALNQLDADLRLRLLTANAPPTSWLAGEMDETDIESKVRHYTDARTAAPQERLYQASLATACLVRVRPPLAQCEAVDRLADWARRDTGNGLPSVLLADRARQRGELDSAASDLDEAAAAPRFDDYWSQGALHWWNYLRPLPVDVDPAVKAKAAAIYASERELPWATSLRALCADSGGRSDRMKSACASLGVAMMTRGATFALRRAGARIAETDAADAAARTAAQSHHARIIEATARCAQAQPDFATELESPAASTRARGIEQFGAWASSQARDGEVGACERLTAAK